MPWFKAGDDRIKTIAPYPGGMIVSEIWPVLLDNVPGYGCEVALVDDTWGRVGIAAVPYCRSLAIIKFFCETLTRRAISELDGN